MKFKLTDEQLRILGPVAQGFIVYTGLQVVFITSIAIGVEHLGAMFGIGWCAGMMLIGAVDINRYRKQSKRNSVMLDAALKQMEATCQRANQAIAHANEIISKKRVEGDEWKDN
jgi:hypothetical protein